MAQWLGAALGTGALALACGCAQQTIAPSPPGVSSARPTIPPGHTFEQAAPDSPSPSYQPPPPPAHPAPPCRARDLAVRVVGDAAYTSHDVPIYQLQNVGAASCSLHGYVTERASPSASQHIAIRLVRMTSGLQGRPVLVRTVTLAPRAAAQFFTSALYGDSCSRPVPHAVEFLLAGEPLHGENQGDFCPGQTVDVSPFYAAAYVPPFPQ